MVLVETAEKLHSSDHGYADFLARVTGVSFKLASRVIKAMKEGDQKKLYPTDMVLF